MDRSPVKTRSGFGRAAPATAAAVLCCASLAGVLVACGGDGKSRVERPLAEPSGVVRPVPKTPDLGVADERDALSIYAADLQSLFDQMKSSDSASRSAGDHADPWSAPGEGRTPGGPLAPPTPSPTATSVREPVSPPAPEPVVAAPDPAPVAALDEAALGDANEPAPPEATPEQRREELLAQLSAILSSGGGDPARLGSEGPLGRAVRLAALEAIEPGVATAELDRLEAELLPAEAAVLRPLREMFSRLGGSAAAQGDPGAIASLMEEYAKRVARAQPLTLPAAVLCERVESFGRYTPMRTTFAAGREHTAILYVEVENFVQRSAPGEGSGLGASEVWVTELGQSLDLHHDADGSLQWRQTEQTVRDASRRRRSDYYLVQRVTLPATLSVGKYNLKVTVKDKVSGATAQARIPIQIVADASLATSPRR